MATKDDADEVSDNTLLIATDEGKIYRLVEERWRLPEFELGGDAADFLKERLLDNGVVAAHLPVNLIDPFFACYLLNLAMLKQTSAQMPEPEPKPRPRPRPRPRPPGGKHHAGQARGNEGRRRSRRRRHGS